MKKVVLSLVLFGAMFFVANTASARGVIIYSNGEKIEEIKQLPDSVLVNEEHVNLGVMYNQFSIFWIPMWNYGETKYVLINDKETTYYDISPEEFEMLKTEFNVNVPTTPVIGFWNKTGGKIIWGGLILAAVAGWWFSRKDDKESKSAQTTE